MKVVVCLPLLYASFLLNTHVSALSECWESHAILNGATGDIVSLSGDGTHLAVGGENVDGVKVFTSEAGGMGQAPSVTWRGTSGNY